MNQDFTRAIDIALEALWAASEAIRDNDTPATQEVLERIARATIVVEEIRNPFLGEQEAA